MPGRRSGREPVSQPGVERCRHRCAPTGRRPRRATPVRGDRLRRSPGRGRCAGCSAGSARRRARTADDDEVVRIEHERRRRRRRPPRHRSGGGGRRRSLGRRPRCCRTPTRRRRVHVVGWDHVPSRTSCVSSAASAFERPAARADVRRSTLAPRDVAPGAANREGLTVGGWTEEGRCGGRRGHRSGAGDGAGPGDPFSAVVALRDGHHHDLAPDVACQLGADGDVPVRSSTSSRRGETQAGSATSSGRGCRLDEIVADLAGCNGLLVVIDAHGAGPTAGPLFDDSAEDLRTDARNRSSSWDRAPGPSGRRSLLVRSTARVAPTTCWTRRCAGAGRSVRRRYGARSRCPRAGPTNRATRWTMRRVRPRPGRAAAV